MCNVEKHECYGTLVIIGQVDVTPVIIGTGFESGSGFKSV